MKENTVQRAASASLLSPAAPAGIHSLSLSRSVYPSRMEEQNYSTQSEQIFQTFILNDTKWQNSIVTCFFTGLYVHVI